MIVVLLKLIRCTSALTKCIGPTLPNEAYRLPHSHSKHPCRHGNYSVLLHNKVIQWLYFADIFCGKFLESVLDTDNMKSFSTNISTTNSVLARRFEQGVLCKLLAKPYSYWVGLALDSRTLGQVNHNPGVPI